MPPVGFEPTISAGERPQTYALDRPDTGIGKLYVVVDENLTELSSIQRVDSSENAKF